MARQLTRKDFDTDYEYEEYKRDLKRNDQNFDKRRDVKHKREQ